MFLQTEKFMKTIVTIATLFAAMTLAACGKKEEAKPVEAAPVAAPAVAPATPAEPAKQEEAKK
jgi:hypothetical protein